MSNLAIRAGLEQTLVGIKPPLPTAWENVEFAPPDNLPSQEVFLMYSAPENPTMGGDHYRQRGYMQVNVSYPQKIGAGEAQLRAELLRNTFYRGFSVNANDVITHIESTPEVSNGTIEGNRYVIKVFIYFYADIFTGFVANYENGFDFNWQKEDW